MIVVNNEAGNLHSHHLDDYENHLDLRYDVENGVCLCDKCHKEFHVDYMGGNRKSCSKEDYEDFKEVKKNYDIK